MTLRSKLIAAQLPLAIALIVVGGLSVLVMSRVGDISRDILADNQRSVLAAQRMKESLERIHTQALLEPSAAAIERHGRLFDAELRVQEGNITEPGEGEVTFALRQAWTRFDGAMGAQAQLAAPARAAAYAAAVAPAFVQVKDLADEVLTLNQDAMTRRSVRVERRVRLLEWVIIGGVLLAFALGLWASVSLTSRILRPLGIVTAAVRRFGEGDLEARAKVTGRDEIAGVAGEINAMADRLERYRGSSLGELIAAQQAAQAAIDGLPDPVLLLNAEGRLTSANGAATRLLGIDPDAADADAWGRVDPGVRAAIDRTRAHALGGKGAYVSRGFEDALRVGDTPDGERVFLPRATPIYGEAGVVSGAAIVLQDATRMFRFDELKNDLVATVAHELRTPLTSLRMALHLCTEEAVGPLTPKQADLLFAGREDCERLQSIVDDLLNLSKLESGHVDLQRRRVDPESLVDAAVDVHRAAAQQADVRLQTAVLPGLTDLFVDPDRLQLVFTNLVSNAIRHSPAGGTIWLRARAEGQTVRFEVADEGPGIPPDHQAALFEKFFRIPGSDAGGSGLGLFIAKGLVGAHGGQIGVESQPGQGATFWFTIPVATS